MKEAIDEPAALAQAKAMWLLIRDLAPIKRAAKFPFNAAVGVLVLAQKHPGAIPLGLAEAALCRVIAERETLLKSVQQVDPKITVEHIHERIVEHLMLEGE